MEIAIASQNRRTTTAHAGKCTHFWVLNTEKGSCVSLQLEPEQMLSLAGDLAEHPLQQVDVVLAASAGQQLAARLASVGTILSLTEHGDPRAAAEAWLKGCRPAPSVDGNGRCLMIIGRT
ncbi:hypothetical protein [uncultured Aquitalea sp.]|uniref:NifB/NifX family molybdenum-iron cluster-binding protein n=1 Tax=uncultured Aquitalea sp. TaxID=540272 RepID=UPI0025FC0EA8|nr:hypothetical protein [uncultured Aquitalea sp.]